jgi:hypothetical protein
MKQFILFTSLFFAVNLNILSQPHTPEEVVSMIKKQVTCAGSTETVDVFKAGNPDSPLKGIAVCMFADMPTLEKAVELGCNFSSPTNLYFTVILMKQNLSGKIRFSVKKWIILKRIIWLFFVFTITST